MPVESAADRAAFFDAADFGDAALIGANSVPGILDNEYIEVDDVGETRPVYHCDQAVALAAGAAVNASIVITPTRTGVPVTYAIRELQPDGAGMLRLILEEQ